MIPPRPLLLLLTCITCCGFARSSVAASATQEQEARSPLALNFETETINQVSGSSVELRVAQASSPKPTNTIPTLEQPQPPAKKTLGSHLSKYKWYIFWGWMGLMFAIAIGAVMYLLIRYGNQSDASERSLLPDKASADPSMKSATINPSITQVEASNNGYNRVISPFAENAYLESSTPQEQPQAHHQNNPTASIPETPGSIESISPAQSNALSIPETPGSIESISPAQSNALSIPETPGAVESTSSPQSNALSIPETTRLAKFNIIDELVQDLHNPDPAKRRKVIWELAQRGDSRAMQPLVDLMMNVDSKQRGLILEALAQISTRTLKPISRALAISLQDENSEVRKNAIRDLTQIYEPIAQVSHLLRHAIEDPDPEVQETARWALNQLNRIRALPGMENHANPKNPPDKY
jgi:HEAT repeats